MVGSVQETLKATGEAVPARLHTAAIQFESLMLKELLTPLTKSCGEADGDDAQAGPLQGFAADSVATSMAQSGALGFARQIEATLQRRAQNNFAAAVKS